MADRDDIYGKIKASLCAALGVDDEEIVPDARLIDDLGAESIDFLDIVFRLEKAFGIKIPRGGLFPENILSNDTFVKDGKVTEQGLAELKKRMPYANLAALESDPRVSNFSSVFTVDLIRRYIENALP